MDGFTIIFDKDIGYGSSLTIADNLSENNISNFFENELEKIFGITISVLVLLFLFWYMIHYQIVIMIYKL